MPQCLKAPARYPQSPERSCRQQSSYVSRVVRTPSASPAPPPYRYWKAPVLPLVRQLLYNREEAEDATSEFFIRLWEKSESYKPGSGHKGWMATIARNLAIDSIRRRIRFSPSVLLRCGSTSQGFPPDGSVCIHLPERRGRQRMELPISGPSGQRIRSRRRKEAWDSASG